MMIAFLDRSLQFSLAVDLRLVFIIQLLHICLHRIRQVVAISYTRKQEFFKDLLSPESRSPLLRRSHRRVILWYPIALLDHLKYSEMKTISL